MKSLLTAAIVLCGLTLAGCGHNATNTVKGSVDGPADVIIRDGYTARITAVKNIRQAFKNDLLNAQVEVHNTTNEAHSFRFRWYWYDESGMTVESTLSRVIEQRIQAGAFVDVAGTAPQSSVRDWKLEIKRVN